MKLYLAEATHPHTKLLQLTTKYAGVEVEEIVLKKEDNAEKFKYGSLVAFESGSQDLFEYKAIAKLIASHKAELLGASNFEQALVAQWMDLSETQIIAIGSPVINMIFNKIPVDMEVFD